MTINTTTLRQALQETEQALNILDASMAIFEARVNANRLPVRWAEQSVKLLTGGRAATWAFDFDGWKANPAAAIAVIVLCNGVHVWTTDPANGQLADYLGAITPLTTPAEVWQMRQTYARKLAREYGLTGIRHPVASSFQLQDTPDASF